MTNASQINAKYIKRCIWMGLVWWNLTNVFQCRLFFFGWKIFPLQWTFFFDTRLRRQMVIWCGRFIFCQKYTKRLLQQSTNFLQTNSNVIKIIILISNIIIILSLPTICLYKPMQNHHRHHNDTFCFPSCGVYAALSPVMKCCPKWPFSRIESTFSGCSTWAKVGHFGPKHVPGTFLY